MGDVHRIESKQDGTRFSTAKGKKSGSDERTVLRRTLQSKGILKPMYSDISFSSSEELKLAANLRVSPSKVSKFSKKSRTKISNEVVTAKNHLSEPTPLGKRPSKIPRRVKPISEHQTDQKASTPNVDVLCNWYSSKYEPPNENKTTKGTFHLVKEKKPEKDKDFGWMAKGKIYEKPSPDCSNPGLWESYSWHDNDPDVLFKIPFPDEYESDADSDAEQDSSIFAKSLPKRKSNIQDKKYNAREFGVKDEPSWQAADVYFSNVTSKKSQTSEIDVCNKSTNTSVRKKIPSKTKNCETSTRNDRSTSEMGYHEEWGVPLTVTELAPIIPKFLLQHCSYKKPKKVKRLAGGVTPDEHFLNQIPDNFDVLQDDDRGMYKDTLKVKIDSLVKKSNSARDFLMAVSKLNGNRRKQERKIQSADTPKRTGKQTRFHDEDHAKVLQSSACSCAKCVGVPLGQTAKCESPRCRQARVFKQRAGSSDSTRKGSRLEETGRGFVEPPNFSVGPPGRDERHYRSPKENYERIKTCKRNFIQPTYHSFQPQYTSSGHSIAPATSQENVPRRPECRRREDTWKTADRMGSSRTFVSETGAWVSVSRDLDDTFYDLNNTNTIWTNRDSRGSRRHRDVSCRMPSERSPDNTIYCPSRCYKEPSKKSNTLDLTEYMPIRKSSRCRSPRAVDRTEELPRTKCDLSPCGSLTSYDGDISLRSPGLLSSANCGGKHRYPEYRPETPCPAKCRRRCSKSHSPKRRSVDRIVSKRSMSSTSFIGVECPTQPRPRSEEPPNVSKRKSRCGEAARCQEPLSDYSIVEERPRRRESRCESSRRRSRSRERECVEPRNINDYIRQGAIPKRFGLRRNSGTPSDGSFGRTRTRCDRPRCQDPPPCQEDLEEESFMRRRSKCERSRCQDRSPSQEDLEEKQSFMRKRSKCERSRCQDQPVCREVLEEDSSFMRKRSKCERSRCPDQPRDFQDPCEEDPCGRSRRESRHRKIRCSEERFSDRRRECSKGPCKDRAKTRSDDDEEPCSYQGPSKCYSRCPPGQSPDKYSVWDRLAEQTETDHKKKRLDLKTKISEMLFSRFKHCRNQKSVHIQSPEVILEPCPKKRSCTPERDTSPPNPCEPCHRQPRKSCDCVPIEDAAGTTLSSETDVWANKKIHVLKCPSRSKQSKTSMEVCKSQEKLPWYKKLQKKPCCLPNSDNKKRCDKMDASDRWLFEEEMNAKKEKKVKAAMKENLQWLKTKDRDVGQVICVNYPEENYRDPRSPWPRYATSECAERVHKLSRNCFVNNPCQDEIYNTTPPEGGRFLETICISPEKKPSRNLLSRCSSHCSRKIRGGASEVLLETETEESWKGQKCRPEPPESTKERNFHDEELRRPSNSPNRSSKPEPYYEPPDTATYQAETRTRSRAKPKRIIVDELDYKTIESPKTFDEERPKLVELVRAGDDSPSEEILRKYRLSKKPPDDVQRAEILEKSPLENKWERLSRITKKEEASKDQNWVGDAEQVPRKTSRKPWKIEDYEEDKLACATFRKNEYGMSLYGKRDTLDFSRPSRAPERAESPELSKFKNYDQRSKESVKSDGSSSLSLRKKAVEKLKDASEAIKAQDRKFDERKYQREKQDILPESSRKSYDRCLEEEKKRPIISRTGTNDNEYAASKCPESKRDRSKVRWFNEELEPIPEESRQSSRVSIKKILEKSPSKEIKCRRTLSSPETFSTEEFKKGKNMDLVYINEVLGTPQETTPRGSMDDRQDFFSPRVWKKEDAMNQEEKEKKRRQIRSSGGPVPSKPTKCDYDPKYERNTKDELERTKEKKHRRFLRDKEICCDRNENKEKTSPPPEDSARKNRAATYDSYDSKLSDASSPRFKKLDRMDIDLMHISEVTMESLEKSLEKEMRKEIRPEDGGKRRRVPSEPDKTSRKQPRTISDYRPVEDVRKKGGKEEVGPKKCIREEIPEEETIEGSIQSRSSNKRCHRKCFAKCVKFCMSKEKFRGSGRREPDNFSGDEEVKFESAKWKRSEKLQETSPYLEAITPPESFKALPEKGAKKTYPYVSSKVPKNDPQFSTRPKSRRRARDSEEGRCEEEVFLELAKEKKMQRDLMFTLPPPTFEDDVSTSMRMSLN